MTLSHDLQEQLSKLDQQIIDLLNDRVKLCAEALEEDEEALSGDYTSDTVGEWEGIADEHGWNLHLLGKVCRSIIDFCKNAVEE